MSRQRLSPSLREATHHICPRCQGTGTVRDNNSLSLSILRLIQEEAMKDNTVQIDVIVPVPIASYLLNEKRRAITNIERMHPDVKIVIAGDEEMETPLYKVIRKRRGEETDVLSYNLPKLIRELEEEEEDQVAELVVEEAVLSGPKVEASKAPKAKAEPKKVEKSTGLFSGLFKKIRQLFVTEKEAPKPEVKPQQNRRRDNQRSNNRRQRNNRNNNAAAAANNTTTEEVKEPTRNNRRSKQNNNGNTNTTNNIKADKVVNETAQPKQKEAKPRRQPRNLTKSVRVKNSDAPVQNEQERIVIPSLLLPIIVPETGENKAVGESQPKRQRRTSRHLRMNTPRTKRRGKNTELKQSPVPLSFAAASLELALGRVAVDYSQVNSEQPNNAVPVIPSLLLPIVIKDEVNTNSAEKAVVSDRKPQQPKVAATSSQVDIDVQENKPQTDEVVTMPATETTAGYSSSVMTKAPAPDYVESNSGIKTREELDYHYEGKGNAGGLSAQDHAYAAASKPVIPE